MISWQHHREKTPHVEGTDGQDRTLQQPGFVAADLGYPQVINAMNTSESFNFIQLRSSIVESRYRGGPHPSQPRLRCATGLTRQPSRWSPAMCHGETGWFPMTTIPV